MFTHRELGGRGVLVFFVFYYYFFNFLSDLETTEFLLKGSDACGGIPPR